MNRIDVSQMDLNLLVTLDTLLRTGSVTAAANELGLGQPAVSHALKRLRELFADPLFVRCGRTLAATPRALSIRGPLAKLLVDAGRLVQDDVEFDAITSTRSFTLCCPDILAPILPDLVSSLYAQAPHARVEVVARHRDDVAGLAEGKTDLVLNSGRIEAAGLHTRSVGSIRFGIVLRRGHPALTRRHKLSARSWVAYPHIMVRSGSGSRSIVAAELDRKGLERKIGLVVPTFLSALHTLSQTDFMLAAPRELVRALVQPLGLVVVEPPIDLPAVKVAALWHDRFHADPAHRFFRTLVVERVQAELADDSATHTDT